MNQLNHNKSHFWPCPKWHPNTLTVCLGPHFRDVANTYG